MFMSSGAALLSNAPTLNIQIDLLNPTTFSGKPWKLELVANQFQLSTHPFAPF